MIRELAVIACFGALGAMARYGVGLWSTRLPFPQFPFGTLIVNVLGCFLMGVVVHLGISAKLMPHWAVTGLSVGFLGAFTTFSAFGYQTVQHLENYDFQIAFANVAANLVLGLLAVWCGLTLARSMVAGG
jgi:CrcB protein